MKVFVATGLIVGLLLACSTKSTDKIPSDIAEFIDDRETCEHLLGEIPDPDQVERMHEVLNGINHYCNGIDQRLRELKKKYARDSSISRKLNGYESLKLNESSKQLR